MTTANEPAAPLERQWPRCSAYVIEGGLIRPAAEGAFTYYSPAAASRAARSQEARPYKQLLRLAQRIGMVEPDALGTRERRELERWLAANGLLGVLPHETLSYRSWPHWRPMNLQDWPAEKPPLFMPLQSVVHRGTNGWTTLPRQVGNPQPVDRLGDPSAPVAPEFLNETAEPPETVYRTWPKGEIERAPLAERWGRYFPGLSRLEAERHEYPSFAGLEFWQAYAEPLAVFLHWPLRLADALMRLAGGREGGEAWRQIMAVQALDEISDAAFGNAVGATLKTDGSIVLRQNAPSLISCYATMMLEDLAAGQQVYECPICGGYFLSSAYQARYCSTSCRYTHHKRQQRSGVTTAEPEAQAGEQEPQ